MSEQERTEQATPKRRQEARKKGQVAKSREVVAAVGFVAAVATLIVLARPTSENAFELVSSSLSEPFAVQADEDAIVGSGTTAIMFVLKSLGLFFIAIAIAGVAANVLQTGFLFLPRKAAPDFSRINPLKNARALFSMGVVAQLLYNLLKTAAFVGLVLLAMRRDAETLASLSNGEPIQIVLFLFRFISRLAIQLCAAFVIFAAADYGVRRWKYEKDLMMTRQEALDELKEESGSPQAKGKRKEMRRTLLDSVGAIGPSSPSAPIANFRRAKDSQAREPRRMGKKNE